MSLTVTTIPNGLQLPLDSLPLTITYSGSFVATLSCTYAGHTYTQTFTNNGTNITAISGWIQS